MKSIFKRFSPWLVFVSLLALLLIDFGEIDGRFLGGDASQNLRSALNLLHHGIYGEAPLGDSVFPGYRREPAPNFLLSFYLSVLAKFVSEFSYQGFPVDSTLVMMSKWINLTYVAALFTSIWLLIRLLIIPLFAADYLTIPLLYLINHFFVVSQLNNLNTELPAALCLVWLSLSLTYAHQSSRWFWIWMSGLSFGLLVLTKASGAYIALVVIPVIILCISFKSRQFFKVLALFSLGFVLSVMPWIVRNHHEFGRPVVAQGAGDVLLIRSVFNTMSNQELAYSFYAYAPKVIRDDWLGPWMGLSQDDLECGQALDRFNRNLTCDKKALEEQRYDDVRSFYQIGKRALPRSMDLTREQKKSVAIDRILSDPSRHSLVSLPLAWRGLWSFGKKASPIAVILNFMSYLALFIAPVLGIIQRRFVWIYLSLVPIGYFVFFAAFSHFLPRYSEPLIPLAMICLLLMVVDCVSNLFPALKLKLSF